MLSIMLQILNISIEKREADLVEHILKVVNRVLGEAALQNNEMDTGDKEDLTKLLEAIGKFSKRLKESGTKNRIKFSDIFFVENKIRKFTKPNFVRIFFS